MRRTNIWQALVLICLCAVTPVQAQQSGGFFGKVKGLFSSEIHIGTYTFKDGSVLPLLTESVMMATGIKTSNTARAFSTL